MTDTDMSVHRSPAVLTGVVSNYRGCADDLINIAAILNRVDDDTPRSGVAELYLRRGHQPSGRRSVSQYALKSGARTPSWLDTPVHPLGSEVEFTDKPSATMCVAVDFSSSGGESTTISLPLYSWRLFFDPPSRSRDPAPRLLFKSEDLAQFIFDPIDEFSKKGIKSLLVAGQGLFPLFNIVR